MAQGNFRKTKLSIAIGVLLASRFAGAATFVVNTTDDGIVEDGQVSLREALEAANTNTPPNADVGGGDPDGDIIRFDATVFAPANSATITTTGLTVTEDVVIDGITGGVQATLDGGNANRIVDIDTDEPVDILGLRFVDGDAGSENGGAIRLGAGGDLTLSGITVSNSTANAGGAIEVVSGDLAVLNSSLSGNSALINGGGLHVSGAGTISIANSVIQSNTAGQEGGGLWNSATGGMSITSSTVSSNTAQIAYAANDAQGGGGVFNNGGTVTINNSVVSTNVVSGPSAGADDGGGGIFNDGRNTIGARISLTGTTTIADNTVSGPSLNGGGGLNIGAAGNGAEISASANVSISGNSATRAGGGLESNNATLTLMGSTVSGNSTGVNGGGVHLTSADSAVISGASITGNTAGQEGGGLWNSASGDMAVSNSTVSNNTALIGNAAGDAQGGGGAFNNGGTLTFHNTSISNNVVSGLTAGADDGGGGIFNDGRNTVGALIRLTGSTTISDNTVLSTSLNGGGGLNIGAGNGAEITATSGVQITGNSAARAGGGLESNNATLTLTGVTISGNSTGVNGGGVHVTAADQTTISDSTISANTAGQEGGGLWNSATGDMAVSNSTVSGNTALIGNAFGDAQGGGGAFNNGGTLTFHNTSISNNVVSGLTAGADDGGGGIFNDGRNTAGALIRLTGSTTISDNTVLSTSLNGGGGLIIGASYGGEIGGAEIVATSGVQITGNTAARAGGGLESNNGVLTLTGVTISGNSTGINGGGVHVTAADQTTISDSTISANTAGQEGGGLWNSATGDMAVSNSTVSGNTALIGNAFGDAQGGGGAFNNGGTLTFHNTSISNNVVSGLTAGADDGGGGIFNDGRNTAGALIRLTGSTTISDNTVLSPSLNGGGGLNIGAGNGAEIVATSGVQVSGNTAARVGGGLESNNGVLTLTGVTISGNSTGVNGGGVHVTGADLTTISNASISANTAGQEGGGLWNSATGEMTVIESMISSNTAFAANSADAQGGGGVFNNGGTVTLQRSQIVGNLVHGDLDSTDGGAGVFNDGRNTDGARVTSSDTDIFDNTVVHTNIGLAGRGGAVLTIADNSNSATVAVTGGTVSGNSASQAGGGIELRVLNSDTLGLSSANLSLTGVVVQGNITDNNGGGLHTGGAFGTLSANVQDSEFIGNEAGNEGGGIWVDNNPDAAVTVTDSMLDGNNSPNGGGAFMDGTAGGLSFTRSAIVRNSANTGGGIDTEGGTLSLTNSTVSSNSAASGGGINVDAGTTLDVRFSSIAVNVASNQGGGLRLGGSGNIDLRSSILADNTAPTGPDASGAFDEVSFSLISDTSDLTITTATSNLLNINALLGGLANNGGSTLTHELLIGSPAVDSAEDAICPGADQRGRVRDDGQCDMGAFESVAEQPGPDFVVNALGDAGDGSCGPDIGDCTLRAAVEAANLDPDLSTITFDATVFAAPETITLTGGELVVTTDATVDGELLQVTVDADNASRVFSIDDGLADNRDVTVLGLTLTGGLTLASGGAILSRENLSLIDVVLSANTATHGGGLFADPGAGGAVTLTDVMLVGNSALDAGGGLALDLENATVTVDGADISANEASGPGAGARVRGANGAVVMIDDSLISANETSLHGGGLALYLTGDAELALADSTISGNGAMATGGGVVVERLTAANSLTFDGVTIADNTAGHGTGENGGGGGIWVSDQFDSDGGNVTLMGSVVATNTAGLDADSPGADDLGMGSDYSEFQASDSLIGNNRGSGLAEAPLGTPNIRNNLIGDPDGEGVIDPIIGPLAFNVGPTRNHLPLPGSPLVDHFDGCSGTDQRGTARGADADGVAGADCDIGAVEVQNTPVTAVADSNVTNPDTPATGNVLDNDIDADDEDAGVLAVAAVNGDPDNIAMIISGSAGGQFTVAADGTYSFDPLTDFTDLDENESIDTSVNYTVSDGFAEDVGTLAVTVTMPSDALFADRFEAEVITESFAARSAVVNMDTIEARLPAQGRNPVLVLHAQDRAQPDLAMALLHARRIDGRIELRVSLLENGEWVIGAWAAMSDDSIRMRW